MIQTQKLIAKAKFDRLDKYLVDALKDSLNLSRSLIQKLILDGCVSVNNLVVTVPKTEVNVDDVIEITILAPPKTELVAEDLDIEIIYEDEYLAVINKPNDMVVHPGAGNFSGTLINGLLSQFNDLSTVGGSERPGIVHRLDKQTTGLLIVAKDDRTHKMLSEMFANREIYKEYLALVEGVIPEAKGMIDAPIGRHEVNRKKMTVTAKASKKAISNFEVLERYPNASATLIKVVLQTGRTHQIRVHFRFINHPILNDPLYGLQKSEKTSFGQYLHSYKLIFIHPVTKRKMSFESPLPTEFEKKINELKEKG